MVVIDERILRPSPKALSPGKSAGSCFKVQRE
jgi:hypothetical protein